MSTQSYDSTATGLLTVEEAAALLRRPTATLRFWRHAGRGPKSFRVGGRVVYRRDDLEQWIEAEEARSTRGGDAA